MDAVKPHSTYTLWLSSHFFRRQQDHVGGNPCTWKPRALWGPWGPWSFPTCSEPEGPGAGWDEASCSWQCFECPKFKKQVKIRFSYCFEDLQGGGKKKKKMAKISYQIFIFIIHSNNTSFFCSFSGGLIFLYQVKTVEFRQYNLKVITEEDNSNFQPFIIY